jgi:hypothetical protein
VIDTMDFFTTDVLDELSDGRADALRNAVLLVAEQSSTKIDDGGNLVTAIQRDASTVVEALARIGQIIDRINETQTMISGVLTERAAVTHDIVGA